MKNQTVTSSSESDEPRTVELTPVVVQAPWYKKLFNGAVRNKTYWYLSFVLFFAVGIFIAREIQKPSTQLTHAGTNTVKVSIQPGTSTMPPNTTYQVWVSADNPVSFVTVKIVFDPRLVKMIGEVSTTPTPLTRVVKQTAMSEANTTGIIYLSMGLDPTKRSTPPTGTFELATVPMAPNTTTQNLSAVLHLDTTAMQVVNPDASLFTITTADATISLNPPPTPTPTRTPTPTAAPTVTPSPSPAAVLVMKITNIRADSVKSTTAQIMWQTSLPSIGWVTYGASESTLTQQSATETSASSTHTAALSDLPAGTWTYYQISAKDESGATIQSAVGRFKTKAK